MINWAASSTVGGAGSPLTVIMTEHPRLAAFVESGRLTRMPTESGLIDELYKALAELFRSGEVVDEPELDARIGAVHDDPAEVPPWPGRSRSAVAGPGIRDLPP